MDFVNFGFAMNTLKKGWLVNKENDRLGLGKPTGCIIHHR